MLVSGLKSHIRSTAHKLLARVGLRLERVSGMPATSFEECLAETETRIGGPLAIICFDNDSWMLTQLFGAPGNRQILMGFPQSQKNGGPPLLGAFMPDLPGGAYAAVIDIEAIPFESLFEQFGILRQASALFLRAHIGAFSSCTFDLLALQHKVHDFGFEFADIITQPSSGLLQTTSASVLLVAVPLHSPVTEKSRIRAVHRLAEAQSFLSRPIVRHEDFSRIAGRGSFGFPAGVLNPGAIQQDHLTHLLTRGERYSWPQQKSDRRLFFTSSEPLLLTLNAGCNVTSATHLTLSDFPNSSLTRIEDFRLFKFDGQIFSNHSVIFDLKSSSNVRGQINLSSLCTRVGISKLDLDAKRLTWHGFPELSRNLSQTEKNWAMFSDKQRLFILYSFSPYILLEAKDWPELHFTHILDSKLKLPLGTQAVSLRNSINPIDYDDLHWLHIVHAVYPTKQYVFWPVLINRTTLIPVRMSQRPLACGWNSFPSSIIYTCSAQVDSTHFYLFAGADDSTTILAKIPRARLDTEWVEIGK